MRTATSPVTNGESQPQEEEPVRDGDVISTLKLQTEEIALVNACLKEVGEVEEATPSPHVCDTSSTWPESLGKK